MPDQVVANALYIDQLIRAVQPSDRAWATQINGAMRSHYLTAVRETEPTPSRDLRRRGVPSNAVAALEDAGIAITPAAEFDVSPIAFSNQEHIDGADYVRLCRSKGVPVPEFLLDRNARVEEGYEDIEQGEWKNLGSLPRSFLYKGEDFEKYDHELWAYRSSSEEDSYGTGDPYTENQEGVCLALPRWGKADIYDEETVAVFGMICMSNEGETCFFDNDQFSKYQFTRKDGLIQTPVDNQGYPLPGFPLVPLGDPDPRLPTDASFIDEGWYIGGSALVGNEQGVCTACHAGANPFVIHPDDAPFAKLLGDDNFEHFPDHRVWPTSQVDHRWPGNPGPLTDPFDDDDLKQGEATCTGCHRKNGTGGLFPNFMQNIEKPLLDDSNDSVRSVAGGYCRTILANAAAILDVRTGDDDCNDGFCDDRIATMPKGKNPAISAFGTHRDQLEVLCKLTGRPTQVDNLQTDEPNFLSPPIIEAPLYTCTNVVGVQGVVMDAEVDLFVNDTESPVATQEVEDPQRVEFQLSFELSDTDTVYAKQRNADGESKLSRGRSPEPFPASTLPRPRVGSEIHACSESIVVEHQPGAMLTITRNPGQPDEQTFTRRGGSSGYTPIPVPDPDIAGGDIFTATQYLCANSTSAPFESALAEVLTAADDIRISAEQIYEQQRLIPLSSIAEGAKLSFYDENSDPLQPLDETGSWPISWFTFNITGGFGGPLEAEDQLRFEQTLCESGPLNQAKTAPLMPCSQLPAPEIIPPVGGSDHISVMNSVPGADVHVFHVDKNEEIGHGGGNKIRLSSALAPTDQIRVWQELTGPRTCVSAMANEYTVGASQ